MASVKVAVRVRPFNQRERDMDAKLIVQMEGKKTRLLPAAARSSGREAGEERDRHKDFTFDHSYWSYDAADPHYASQEQVFADLGADVIESAFSGYNACVFAYGQTGSGKTFTMMGSPDNQGLIPRICRQLFARVAAGKDQGASYRTEVSYLEIYNERVKDLLAGGAGHALRVREHPQRGPYVQDLSKHLVSDYDDIQECMHRGNMQRTTASTQMNDVSSRSHAIFTVTFVQATYLRHNMPSETVSKVHLVDLAGSERADATGATGQRLVEGAHINKSLVTLGCVISALADAAQPDSAGRTPRGSKKTFIPYRDSVLTWLLKDSLGGNSKTIMIAAVSPADCNYGETLSTLRYANRAKNIINTPTVNEDANVKLIRELREEIDKLRALISHDDKNPSDPESAVLATLQRKEAQEKVLTDLWTEKWRETQQILREQQALGLRKSGLGVVLHCDMPHLVGIDDDLLSTGVTLYNLKEGETIIGTEECSPTPDIVVSGGGVLPLHCRVTLRHGVATLVPEPGAHCWLNTVLIDRPAKLSQGCILLLGRTNMFRYNDPAEAAKLRQEGAASAMNLSRLSLLSWSATDLDLAASTENLNLNSEPEAPRSSAISAQREQLQREREAFLQQQEERQRRWSRDQEQLLRAQRKLDEEREAMEREYSEARRRLSGDAGRRRALRARRRELRARAQRLGATARDHAQCAEAEDRAAAAARRGAGEARARLEQCVAGALRDLAAGGRSLPPAEGPPAERLARLLQQCGPAAAAAVRADLDRHTKELEELEGEVSVRAAAAAAHRGKVDRLRAALELLATQEAGLQEAMGDDSAGEASPEAPRRSRSELQLRARTAVAAPLSADERELARTRSPTPPAAPPVTPPASPPTSPPASPPPSPPDSPQDSPPDSAPDSAPEAPDFRLGPCVDDADDLSSTEDCQKNRIADGQSSSSLDRSPDERHRAKYRRRLPGEARSGRRQVTEAEALRAMQRLCSRIASQKMLVISSLENDCSKEELNRQIAVLQDLQKKYVRLEMALQYSFFDNQSRRNIMVTPIQETPSLTLSESDMHVAPAELADVNDNRHQGDPLMNRLKESELEASDNVSTSNDELQSDAGDWPDDDSRRAAHAALTPVISQGLMHPVNFDHVISVPGWVTRGAGTNTHHEYEVRVSLGAERWLLLRRYRRFRDLYISMKQTYGAKVASIPFPSRQMWRGDSVARARRGPLEAFLRRLLTTLAADPRAPLHRAVSPRTLHATSPFFLKGVFESGKCGTG